MKLRPMGAINLAVVAVLLAYVLACTSRSGGRDELLVFAAVSLTDSLTEIGRAFEQRSDGDVAFSFGGSQELAQQIARGAPADIFISAGQFPVSFLAAKGAIDSDPTNLLSNKLVLVAGSDEIELNSVEGLTTEVVHRIAVADPDLAPAGRYASESLKHLGLWDDIQGKLVFGANVRVTLAYVQSGNADVGLVYETDAMTARELVVLDIVPAYSYSPIVYPAVVVRDSGNRRYAGEFIDFLRSETASAVFRKHGFSPLD